MSETAIEVDQTRLPTRRRCILCKGLKLADEFYRVGYITNQGKVSVRLEPRCKPCARARRRNRYLVHADHERAVGRAYKKNNREAVLAQVRASFEADPERRRLHRRAAEARRRSKRAGPPNTEDVRRVLEEARFGDRYLDAYDGLLIADPTVDHVIPLSEGGAHEYHNLCVTSRSNNSAKRTAPLLVWLALR